MDCYGLLMDYVRWISMFHGFYARIDGCWLVFNQIRLTHIVEDCSKLGKYYRSFASHPSILNTPILWSQICVCVIPKSTMVPRGYFIWTGEVYIPLSSDSILMIFQYPIFASLIWTEEGTTVLIPWSIFHSSPIYLSLYDYIYIPSGKLT